MIVLDDQRRAPAAARRRSPWPGAATSPRRPGSGPAVGGSPRPARHRRARRRAGSTSRPSSSTSTPTTSHDSRSSRSSIGGNPGCSTTTRSPRCRATLGHAVEGVEGTVDDGDRLGRERPRRPQLVLERREHRVVEVARRQRLPADLGDDRGEVREQVGVGRPRRQVEGEVSRSLADLAVAARPARPGRMAHERAVAAAGLDRPDVGEAAPGLRDGRRRDAEAAGQLADGRAGGRRPPATRPRSSARSSRRCAAPSGRRRVGAVGSTDGSTSKAPTISVVVSVNILLPECTVTNVVLSRRRCHITMPRLAAGFGGTCRHPTTHGG